MPDFIPINNVSPAPAPPPVVGDCGPPMPPQVGAGTPNPPVSTPAPEPAPVVPPFAFEVEMTGAYKVSDGEVYFVARLYYEEDEMDPNNVSRVSGQQGVYQLPTSFGASSVLGFTISPDGTDSPALTHMQGSGHHTDDYRVFRFVTDSSRVPIHITVAVHKINEYNGRHLSIAHYEDTSYR